MHYFFITWFNNKVICFDWYFVEHWFVMKYHVLYISVKHSDIILSNSIDLYFFAWPFFVSQGSGIIIAFMFDAEKKKTHCLWKKIFRAEKARNSDDSSGISFKTLNIFQSNTRGIDSIYHKKESLKKNSCESQLKKKKQQQKNTHAQKNTLNKLSQCLHQKTKMKHNENSEPNSSGYHLF